MKSDCMNNENKNLSLGVMVDCSRNAVMNISRLKEFALILKEMGYDNVGLYMEDTYEISNEPYFGHLRGRYTISELKEINSYLRSIGIKFIPYIQTLAHVKTIFQWEKYHQIKDINDIMLVGEEKTYDLIDKMFASLRSCIDGDEIHIGMDEAFLVGLGEYLKRNGYKQNRTDILIEHLEKVSLIAKKYGFNAVMWSDLFYHFKTEDDSKIKVADNITLCNWDYYTTDVKAYIKALKKHKEITDKVCFAGGAWTWTGFAPQNKFAFSRIKSSIDACRKENINKYIVTMWGDDGSECSYFAALPSLFFAAEKFLNNSNIREIKRKFMEKFNVSYDFFMKLDIPNTIRDSLSNNISKWGLYNDPLCGKFDFYIDESDGAKYKSIARKLSVAEKKSKEFSYIFKSLKKLCKVLEYKLTLGVITRKAYLEHDVLKLKEITNNIYPKLIKRVEEFYDIFKAQWYKDNKPFGFEVQDMRLGGLIMRLKHCRGILNDYINGKIEKIEELEQPVLPLSENHTKDAFIYFNDHIQNITANLAHWKATYDF